MLHLSTTVRRIFTSRTMIASSTRTTPAASATATTPRVAQVHIPAAARLFHQSRPARGSTKADHLERDRLNPASTEYSKSGSDADAAAMDDAAFNPAKTSPEEEVGSAERQSGEVGQPASSESTSPLDVSPGNRDVSASKDPRASGPDRSPAEADNSHTRTGHSGQHSPQKHGGGR